jgi:hypothetical protein
MYSVRLAPYTDIQIDSLENLDRKETSVCYMVVSQATNFGISLKRVTIDQEERSRTSRPQANHLEHQGHSFKSSDKESGCRGKRDDRTKKNERKIGYFYSWHRSKFILQNHPI